LAEHTLPAPQLSPPPKWLFRRLTHLELHTLTMLADAPHCPYQIMVALSFNTDEHTKATTAGARRVLRRFETRGWAQKDPGGRIDARNQQFYRITEYGEAQLRYEIEQLSVLIDMADHWLTRAADYRAEARTQEEAQAQAVVSLSI
jgi:DNA-binding PadR family transcriptional regulator